MADLFRPPVRAITIRTLTVCACSLSAWWAFMFWINQHVLNLPDIASWPETARSRRLAIEAFFIVIGTSILGNFAAAFVAKCIGYRRGIALMFVGFFFSMVGAFCTPRGHVSLLWWVPWIGFFSGVFGLFTMYLPPLFPTLLRTTGAGFCYNFGRLAGRVRHRLLLGSSPKWVISEWPCSSTVSCLSPPSSSPSHYRTLPSGPTERQ